MKKSLQRNKPPKIAMIRATELINQINARFSKTLRAPPEQQPEKQPKTPERQPESHFTRTLSVQWGPSKISRTLSRGPGRSFYQLCSHRLVCLLMLSPSLLWLLAPLSQ